MLFTDLLNIDFPIVQAPLVGGYSSPEMVATVSNLGCLGTLALGNSSPEQIEAQCLATQALTDKPFAANFFVIQNQSSPGDSEKVKALQALDAYYTELGIDPSCLYQEKLSKRPDIHEQIEAVMAFNVPIITFTFGIPSIDILKKLREKSTFLMATATTIDEAKMIQDIGFDAVVLQGIEAGGHRASFLSEGNKGPDTSLLLQQMKGSISIPKIVTGGIMNGQQISNYIKQGADACQLGTAYLFTHEAKLNEDYIAAIQKSPIDTCLTKTFTGKYARVVRNKFTQEMENKTAMDFPYQSQLTSVIQRKAAELKKFEYMPFWTGSSDVRGYKQSTESLTRQLISDLQLSLSRKN
ncbi:NAD(P)H-dependent flavin oxidoreductase [Methylophaga sulfidovorans]|uniref:Propionate 3-nitronate monooxygenase n=1 Tax=Methylophaga sulfidovorans TaxID=45496 RepID=A0A1I3UAZ5_9GAMM|nr:nitronate monooxygenase [Methylophaga sulfidovorans]SFJ80170.1 nitronate monooxygenase [Methylophaga sulfidovorans]